MRDPHPFAPHGTGWTLVTFSVPGGPAHAAPPPAVGAHVGGVRSAARRALARARRGRPEARRSKPLRADLPPGAITRVPRARAAGVPDGRQRARRRGTSTAIRAEHLAFIDTWSDPATVAEAGSALAAPHDARRGLAGAAAGRPATSARLHGRRLAGRSLVRGLLGRSASPRGARRRAVRGARRHQPAKRARRSAFRTFPDAVRGSSSTTTTFLGSL